MPRLVCCYDCEVMIPCPDVPDGTPPEHDGALNAIVDRHQHTDIPDSKIKGGKVFVCDVATWQKLGGPEGALTHMKAELRKNQIEIAEFRDELGDDAMKCFNQHHRPQYGCSDYCSDEKTLGRKEGVPPDKRQYLCFYCPVQSFVTTQVRWKKGWYK